MYAALGIASLTGVLAHWLVFNRGEWHLHGPHILAFHSLAALAIFSWLVLEGAGRIEAFATASSLLTVYTASLFGSIAFYRLFLHRLRKFPGPPLAALTKLWHVYECRDSRNFLVLDAWYKKYGTLVRTGPEEITIVHPAAIELLDGARNHNERTDWYDLLHPLISPIFSRKQQHHTERRKVWTRALSNKAIDSYLPRILQQISVLDKAVGTAGQNGVLLNDTMSWFAFDSMGEFAFNESFGMMKSSAWHEAVMQQRAALSLLGPFSCAIWAVRLAFAFGPVIKKVRNWMAMLNFCTERIDRRLEAKSTDPDIASWFIEEYNRNTDSKTLADRRNLLLGNSISVIVGGSDTTAPSLILLWYALAKYPEYAEQIYAEISAIDETDTIVLSTLPHLNAFMNEVMRLFPAALTGGNRITPPEGVWFEGTFIPGNTKIVAPKYSIFRLPAAFEKPEEFLPERWSTSPELVKDKRAFAPFGVGRRACVGKNLALTQIRLVMAVLLKKYRPSFAQGQDGDIVEREMRDQVTAQPGPCRVVFEPRIC